MIAKILLAICASAVASWLNSIAGKGKYKATRTVYRKILMGFVTSITCFLLGLNGWLAILIFSANFGVFSLPITLIGDDIDDHWLNRPWLFILGSLIGSIIWIASGFKLAGFIAAVAYGIVYAILQLLSLKKEGLAEFIYGSLLAFLSCLSVILSTLS